MSELYQSFAAGYECLSAWADLVDRINVFPVADGDTGTNLRISLAPLRSGQENSGIAIDLLARSATGNSGNIAAAFFQEFCRAESSLQLAEKAAAGRDRAWRAVADPRPGTMLTLFDSLAAVLAANPDRQTLYFTLCRALQQAVHDTARLLSELQAAGVVDSGALAMYIFFDGFFHHLTRHEERPCSILDLFAGKLAINSHFRPQATDCYCVDLVMQKADNQAAFRDSLVELGESVVVVEDEAILKVHLHTPEPGRLQGRLGSFGEIVRWSAELIDQDNVGQDLDPAEKPRLHIVSDAAGSISRAMARNLGVSLLDSYIISGDSSRPESLYCPEQLYALMREGKKLTTAQASTFERHQHYQAMCHQFGHCLYLCVGSAFTGNYDAAIAWKKDNDPGGLMTVLDTGAASGRLALITLLTARRARSLALPEEIIAFANTAIAECDELVFIDELKYLVAGGRVSRAGGFFGDLLSMKPVISPTSDGVRKVGVVRSAKGQLAFALGRLTARFGGAADAPVILLQYSDNKSWVAGTVAERVTELLPAAEVILAPLSLTSGVHMGPGTWSIAFGSAHEKHNQSATLTENLPR